MAGYTEQAYHSKSPRLPIQFQCELDWSTVKLFQDSLWFFSFVSDQKSMLHFLHAKSASPKSRTPPVSPVANPWRNCNNIRLDLRRQRPWWMGFEDGPIGDLLLACFLPHIAEHIHRVIGVCRGIRGLGENSSGRTSLVPWHFWSDGTRYVNCLLHPFRDQCGERLDRYWLCGGGRSIFFVPSNTK